MNLLRDKYKICPNPTEWIIFDKEQNKKAELQYLSSRKAIAQNEHWKNNQCQGDYSKWLTKKRAEIETSADEWTIDKSDGQRKTGKSKDLAWNHKLGCVLDRKFIKMFSFWICSFLLFPEVVETSSFLVLLIKPNSRNHPSKMSVMVCAKRNAFSELIAFASLVECHCFICACVVIRWLSLIRFVQPRYRLSYDDQDDLTTNGKWVWGWAGMSKEERIL